MENKFDKKKYYCKVITYFLLLYFDKNVSMENRKDADTKFMAVSVIVNRTLIRKDDGV